VPARGERLWSEADCIFAHQEFRGCKMGAIVSADGDPWSTDRPPVISGHIHSAQTLPTGVWYPGSAIQHAFGEAHDKRVWFVDFSPTDDAPTDDDGAPFSVEKIDIGLPSRRIVRLDSIAAAKAFDVAKLPENTYVKFRITARPDELLAFRKTAKFAELRAAAVGFAFVPLHENPGAAADGGEDAAATPAPRPDDFFSLFEKTTRAEGLGDLFDEVFRR
jgi:hypothetical protein